MKERNMLIGEHTSLPLTFGEIRGAGMPEPQPTPTPEPQSAPTPGITWGILGSVLGIAVFLAIILTSRVRRRRTS
jgi:hypothetical protein